MCMYSSERVNEYVESTAQSDEDRGRLYVPEMGEIFFIRHCFILVCMWEMLARNLEYDYRDYSQPQGST